MRPWFKSARLVLPALLAAGLLAACGGAGSSAGSTSSSSTTTSTSAAPKRIVSLDPTATEILFAIGAGPQVVAVDNNSNYPASAPRTALSGFQPNAEAVARYQPDLVVISNDTNGLQAALKKLQIPVLLQPAPQTLDGSYAQELALGRATGHEQAAAALVARVKAQVAAAVASVPPSARGLKVYHELDQTYYSVTSDTFIGSIYRLFGLRNIADAARNAVSSGGYPQLSAEYVVSSAPDLIVLADSQCCGQTPAKVATRPAFGELPAVRTGRVIAVGDDIASRWGPRVGLFAEAVAKALGGK